VATTAVPANGADRAPNEAHDVDDWFGSAPPAPGGARDPSRSIDSVRLADDWGDGRPVMTRIVEHVRKHLGSEHGQDLLEYAMLAALIAVFAVGAVTTVGNTINTVFWQTIAAASF
jgi:Flp pilus assembly pilin Flp